MKIINVYCHFFIVIALYYFYRYLSLIPLIGILVYLIHREFIIENTTNKFEIELFPVRYRPNEPHSNEYFSNVEKL